MILSARFAPNPSHGTAVSVRVAAAVLTMASVVVIPWAFADAALGHISAEAAAVTAACLAFPAVLALTAARRLDPLR